MIKNANGLVRYALGQLGKPYWYGTFGQAASNALYDQKKRQYPNYYKWDYAGETGKVHDCIGLIKGYLWCDSPDDNTPVYDATQDLSANRMRSACTAKGEMASMPDVPGVLVFMNRHVGVYIGNGEVIEARGHAYGVVKTKLTERPWTSWGCCPYISYEVAESVESTYTQEQFVRDVQAAIGAKVDGKAGPETISKTVTVSRRINRTHAVVRPIQKWLYALGYTEVGDADGKAGPLFEQAVKHYQGDHGRWIDGEITAENITWRKLLGME